MSIAWKCKRWKFQLKKTIQVEPFAYASDLFDQWYKLILLRWMLDTGCCWYNSSMYTMNVFQFTLFWINLYAFTFIDFVTRHIQLYFVFNFTFFFFLFYFFFVAHLVPFFVPSIKFYMFLEIENVSVRRTSMRIHFSNMDMWNVKLSTHSQPKISHFAFESVFWINLLRTWKTVVYSTTF